MFWGALASAFKILTYWETYVAGIEYLLVSLIPLYGFGLFVKRNKQFAVPAGCLSMFGAPILQVVAVLVLVLTLSPIILGISNNAAWSFPFVWMISAPVGFFFLALSLVAIGIMLLIIPVDSLAMVVMSGVALSRILKMADAHVSYIPGFWFSVGLIIIGVGMSWLGRFIAAGLLVALDKSNNDNNTILVLPIATVFNFFPVFMYGAWLGQQLR